MDGGGWAKGAALVTVICKGARAHQEREQPGGARRAARPLGGLRGGRPRRLVMPGVAGRVLASSPM